jgi:cellulose synthase/poly-beta-1,6-N-acetylglucosamine synthase-like glycosyltransferase
LLTNGALENEITWDIAGLAEDFEFALRARTNGHKCGEVMGVVREQSPETLMDFVRQRRRWFLGMRSIRHPCARYVLFQSYVGIACNVYTFLDYFMPELGLLRLPLLLVICLTFQMSVCFYLYILGVVVQDLDAGFTWKTVILHIPVTLVCIPLVALLENSAIVYALFFNTKVFEVIKK